jgi:hypothetical protein
VVAEIQLGAVPTTTIFHFFLKRRYLLSQVALEPQPKRDEAMVFA